MQTRLDGSRSSLLADTVSWHFLVLLAASAIALFARFFHPVYFGYFEDDFFYYAQIAKNLAVHGHSTFDGLHATNGYHPLWLLLFTALYKLFPGYAFYIAVQVTAFFCSGAAYTGILRCLRPITSLATARAMALLLSLYTLLLLRYGMEVTLAVPLGVWTVSILLDPEFAWTTKQTIAYGLLACATVLTRLDCAILFALLWAVQILVARVPFSVRLKRVLIFTACFIPFFLYLASNKYYFHTLLPVSAMAKNLKPLLPPSLAVVRTVLLPFSLMKAAVVVPALFALGAGLWRLTRSWRQIRPAVHSVIAPLLLFPLLQLLILSFTTDWPMGSWPWYFYPLAFSSLAAAYVFLLGLPQQETQPLQNKPSLLLYALCVCYLGYITVYAVRKPPSPLFSIARDAANFADQHPGIYAMGDEAGAFGYFSSQPVIQLEGLTMDHGYLDHIRNREELQDVLQQYHVDYYVRAGEIPPGCFELAEPEQAGSLSPHMPGRLCASPIAAFTASGIHLSIFRAADVQP